ncbi:hypothetical protein BDW59DRAFT_143258 [Aspergillus cavernicola]|uniref:Uncharacterized protein n=1 Tax=Aspergillus cavernicola TaxID=176166 RepID=A0ABR4IL79_9EURO
MYTEVDPVLSRDISRPRRVSCKVRGKKTTRLRVILPYLLVFTVCSCYCAVSMLCKGFRDIITAIYRISAAHILSRGVSGVAQCQTC